MEFLSAAPRMTLQKVVAKHGSQVSVWEDTDIRLVSRRVVAREYIDMLLIVMIFYSCLV